MRRYGTAFARAHRLRSVPVYPVVKSIKQLIMDDYVNVRGVSEVSWRDVLQETRAHCRGYFHVDIAEFVAKELREEGIRVWR